MSSINRDSSEISAGQAGQTGQAPHKEGEEAKLQKGVVSGRSVISADRVEAKEIREIIAKVSSQMTKIPEQNQAKVSATKDKLLSTLATLEGKQGERAETALTTLLAQAKELDSLVTLFLGTKETTSPTPPPTLSAPPPTLSTPALTAQERAQLKPTKPQQTTQEASNELNPMVELLKGLADDPKKSKSISIHALETHYKNARSLQKDYKKGDPNRVALRAAEKSLKEQLGSAKKQLSKDIKAMKKDLKKADRHLNKKSKDLELRSRIKQILIRAEGNTKLESSISKLTGETLTSTPNKYVNLANNLISVLSSDAGLSTVNNIGEFQLSYSELKSQLDPVRDQELLQMIHSKLSPQSESSHTEKLLQLTDLEELYQKKMESINAKTVATSFISELSSKGLTMTSTPKGPEKLESGLLVILDKLTHEKASDQISNIRTAYDQALAKFIGNSHDQVRAITIPAKGESNARLPGLVKGGFPGLGANSETAKALKEAQPPSISAEQNKSVYQNSSRLKGAWEEMSKGLVKLEDSLEYTANLGGLDTSKLSTEGAALAKEFAEAAQKSKEAASKIRSSLQQGDPPSFEDLTKLMENSAPFLDSQKWTKFLLAATGEMEPSEALKFQNKTRTISQSIMGIGSQISTLHESISRRKKKLDQGGSEKDPGVVLKGELQKKILESEKALAPKSKKSLSLAQISMHEKTAEQLRFDLEKLSDTSAIQAELKHLDAAEAFWGHFLLRLTSLTSAQQR